MQTNVGPILAFLTEQFEQFKLSYSAMNTARCALSTFLILPGGHTVGTHPLISRFIRGVFQIRPNLPRYSTIWDVSVVLTYLKTLSPVSDLKLRDLTLKVVMLMALTTAQRTQTLHKLMLSNMSNDSEVITFHVHMLKHSKPGKVGMKIEFKAYSPDTRLCVYTTLLRYIQITKTLRGQEQQLLISYRKPHGKVAKDTISGWIKRTMRSAGVDTSMFKSHSTRAAASSAAKRKLTPITDILAAAGWSSEQTFQSYYNKPLAKESSFANAVLQC